MGKAENYTKRKMADITVFTDDIDIEYQKRVRSIRTKQDLKDILEDFSEFLPEGLQAFRECDDLSFMKLKKQIARFWEMVRQRGAPPGDPTEAVMFIAPPVLTLPRGIARTRSAEEKRPVTWGEAFVDMVKNGMMQQLLAGQESMYRRVIKIKPIVEEAIDTEGI